MTSKERIRLALKRERVSQERYAQEAGVAQGSVSGYLSSPGEVDSIKYLEAAEKLTGYRFEWLRTGNGAEKHSDVPILNEGKPLAHIPMLEESDVKYNVDEEMAGMSKTEDLPLELRYQGVSVLDVKVLLSRVEMLEMENKILRLALREIGIGKKSLEKVGDQQEQMWREVQDKMKEAAERLLRVFQEQKMKTDKSKK